MVAGHSCAAPTTGRRTVTEVAVTEELISFASKQDMLAKSKQFWNPDKTQFWIDSGVPLVIDRREGYFIYDVEGKRAHRRAPQRRHLQPGASQSRGGGGCDRRHAALRHRQPPLSLAGPHRPGRSAGVHRPSRPGQGGVRQWWRRG